MSKYYVTNESTEDTFAETDDLEEAIRVAREVAKNGKFGDLVLVESEGRGIKQFALTQAGNIIEYEIDS